MEPSKPKSNLDKWLALKKKGQQTSAPKGISRRPVADAAPLSHGQQRLWLLQQLYSTSPFYNYAHVYRFKGALDAQQLQQSLAFVAQRHQLPGTSFQEDENTQVIQLQLPERELPFEYLDWSELDVDNQAKRLEELQDTQRNHTFDLAQDALIRATLVRLTADEHVLILLLHHIIGDRSSLGIINREFAAHYRQQLLGTTTELPELALDYADFAYWQQQKKVSEKSLQYWLDRLAAPRSILEMPADFPVPAEPSFRGQTLRRTLPKELSKQLQDFAKAQQTTLFVLGLALFKAVLYRYSGQTDLLIGAPFSNRDRSELNNLVGFFNETLVLRSDINAEGDFLELLEQVKRHTLDALNHKDIPFDQLVQELKPERLGSSNPLFQAMFVMNEPAEHLDFGQGLQLAESILDLQVAKFDLTLFLTQTADGLELALEYASDLFREDTIERMLGHLEILSAAVVADPKQSLSTLPLLSPDESTQILQDWNKSDAPLPEAETILTFFDQQVQERPKQIAVQFGLDSLTYAQLNRRANALTHRLQKELGAEFRNTLVGLYTEPSVELLVGIIGIMKAGAAYLPLDPAYPEHRISYMLEDAAVSAVVTTPDLARQFPNQNVALLVLRDEQEQEPSPSLVDHRGSDLA